MHKGNSYINKSVNKVVQWRIVTLCNHLFLLGGNMSRLEAAAIIFGILFLIIFLLDYLFIKRSYLRKISKGKKKKKTNELTEIAYLVGRFKLDKQKLNLSRLLVIISLINSFIISLVAVVVLIINVHVVFQLLIGFVLLMTLIFAMYEILGQYLVKKENENV